MQIIGAICVIAAKVYVVLNQLESDVLDDAWSINDVLKWQAPGQVAAAASIAPDSLRFVALASSSFICRSDYLCGRVLLRSSVPLCARTLNKKSCCWAQGRLQPEARI